MFFPIRNQSLTDFESQFQTLVSMETIERLFTLFLVLNFVQLPRVFANPETLLLNETTENPMFVMPWESYRPLWQSKFQAFNFYNSTRTVYPLTVSSSWKKNLFVRDALPLEVIYPIEHGSGLQRRAKTQVAVGTREACHNDKNNISLPATWTPTHPLLATLFRVNMLTKLEASVPEAEFNIRHVVLAGGNAKEVKNDHVLCYGYIDRADTGFHMGKFFLTRVELLAYICALVLLMLRHCISRKQSEVEGTEGKARRKRKKKAKRAKSGRDTGITIGKLFVSNNEIAKGSHGTIVLDGRYHDVPVAVKRLLKTHHNIAIKEWKALTKVADHENIIRWFGMEEDSYFWYISLERCPCNLHDFIVNRTGNSDCWKASGHPTEELLSIMRGIVAGVSFLHSVGIVHRDLKPSNVLLKENTENKCLIAKVCDMGFSKLISGDKSSIREVDKAGSSGWQPIEQFLGKRQTRAVDAFSLGCVLFFCATGGKHPYGDLIERSFNIVHDKKKLFLQIPEAVDLFTSLLDPSASMRPKVKDVLFHPFLWRSKERLKFLIDTSGWVEREARNGNSDFVDSVENIALPASTNMWNVKFHRAFLSHMRTYRKYEYNSVQDLLRLIRNTVSHYNEFPAEIQRLVGPIPDGFDVYVSMRFPKLFFEIYKLICILYGTEFITEYVKNLLTKSFIM